MQFDCRTRSRHAGFRRTGSPRPPPTSTRRLLVIRHKDKDLIAASANDGRLYVLDAASLGGADHRTPLAATDTFTDAGAGTALATFEDASGRWIFATASGTTGDVKFAENGAAPTGRIVAFKLVDEGGKLTLVPGWQSRDLTSPLAPIVVNGMVFAVSSGEYRGGPSSLPVAQRAQRSSPAVLYVLDAATGRALWNSGATIKSFARGGAFRRRRTGLSRHLRQSAVHVRDSARTLRQPLSNMSDRSSDPGRHRRRRAAFFVSSRAGCRARSCIPGRRLRLHPDDLYALGAHRGGINERWFSSTTNADNGPGTPADEGLSYVRLPDGQRLLLKAAVDAAGDLLLGAAVMEREKGWNLLCKFFDNMGPIPHHMHQSDEHAQLVGRRGKPEAYYFPPQYNPTDNNFPYTFMGLEPGTTKDDVRRCLENWNTGDNGITLPVARVSSRARHRLADRSRHPARAGFAR